MATEQTGPTPTSISVGSHETALCIIPPPHLWPSLDRLRSRYDKAYGKWPPHINLIYPFARVETLPRACELIESNLAESTGTRREESIRVRLDSAGVFKHRNDNTIYFHDGDEARTQQLRSLRRRILKVLGQQDGSFQMHLTLGQSEDVHDSWHKFLVQKVDLLPPVEWEVSELCVLVRERTQTGSSEMKKWAAIPLNGKGFSKLQPSLSFYDQPKADTASDNDEEEPISEQITTRPSFRLSISEDVWVPYQRDVNDTFEEIPETFTVASYNVLAEFHYPPSSTRYPLLVKNILSNRARADALVLQEVTDDFLSYLLGEESVRDRYRFVSHGPPDQEDVEPLPSHNNIVVLSSFPFDWESVSSRREHKSSVVAKFRNLGIWDDTDFTPLVLAAVHLTCGLKDGSVVAKKAEISRILKYLTTEYSDHPTILAGDFNISTSSYTLEAALERKAISTQTAGYLSGFEKTFLDAGFLDSWTVSHLEAGNASDDETEHIFEGEQGATFDPTVNTLAESIVGSGFNMRPQRYDRILVRSEGLLRISRFNKFGFITEETSPAGESIPTQFASDHWGIRCILSIGSQITQQSNQIADQVVPVTLTAATSALSDVRSLKESLQEQGAIPTEEDTQIRESAFNLLKDVILETSRSNDASSRYNALFVLTPVGSYGLGVWTHSSDIDCLCIGPVSANTFFALASQRLRKAADKGVKLLRRVKALSGTMLELEVQGVKIDLQYCGATRVAERWPEVLRLPASDPIWTLPSQTLGKLKAVRDLDYVRRSLPDLVKFRLAHRFIKTWAQSRGIYSAKWGYLGGFPITILLGRVCKFLARDVPSHSVADILTTFFSHYAAFDWLHKMAFDPFFHRQRLQYTRTPREPLAILGYHTPMLTTTKAASLPSVRTIAEEMRRAHRLLSEEGMTWSKFLGSDGELNTGATDFLKSYRSYIQITVQYWGISLTKGSSFVGWLESRCVMVLVDINRRLPNIHARIWPARFVEESAASDTADYQGCYLIGLDRLDDDMTKEDLKIALGTLQTILGRFEAQIRCDEKYFDAKSSWMNASIVKQSELGNLILDGRDWGEYNPGDDESEDEEEEEEQDSPAEESSSGQETGTGKKSRKGKKQQRQNVIVPKREGAGKFRTAADVLNRIRWDSSLDSGDFVVGYEDRFVGAQEKALDTWKSEQTDEEFIPQHRILYFKRKSDGAIMWERKTRKDEIFKSGT